LAVEDSRYEVGDTVFFCSTCHKDFGREYGCDTHIRMNSTCKTANPETEIVESRFQADGTWQEVRRIKSKWATPMTYNPSPVPVPQAVQEPEPEVTEETQAIQPEPVVSRPAPEPAPVFPPVISQAQRAAMGVSAPWDDEDDEVDDYASLPPVPPTPIGRSSASLQISPEPWMVVAWQTARGDGYDGSIGNLMHEWIQHYFVLIGVKIEIFNVPEYEREVALATVGLSRGR
jgi:hypothetical protein